LGALACFFVSYRESQPLKTKAIFANCEELGTIDTLRVISRKRLLEAAAWYSDASGPLDAWYRIAKKAAWKNLAEVRKTFSTADSVGAFTVFNIKGNTYRLITWIKYETQKVFIKHVLTHADYDKENWKE
jgi:mRNA interferase HigB